MHHKNQMNNKQSFPTGWQAAGLSVALFLAEVLIGAGMRDAQGVLGMDDMALGAMTVLLANAVIFAIALPMAGITYRQLFHSSASSVAATFALLLLPVLLLVPGLLLVMSGVMDVLLWLAPQSKWEARWFEQMASNHVANIVAVCVLAPVLEEMLFRGVYLRSFLRLYPRWQAILGSAILFGAMHLNIYQFFGGFIVGTLLGWLYERTHSLVPCIALHAFYNTAITLLQPSSPGEGSSATWALSVETMYAAAVLTPLALWFLFKILGRHADRSD